MSPRAEALLLLARYANVLVTREQILDTVWAGRVVEDAAITHCVWQIRKSLGDAALNVQATQAKAGDYERIAAQAAQQTPPPPQIALQPETQERKPLAV